MSAESVLREAVDDHRRELAALRARVKELEADLRTGIELWDGKWHGDEFWRRRANWLNSVCAKLRDADALHRPTPSQERP